MRRTTRGQAQAQVQAEFNNRPKKTNQTKRHRVNSQPRPDDIRPPSPPLTQPTRTIDPQPATAELELHKVTVHNYNLQKQFWPLPRIEEQLARQSPINNSKPSPLIVAEATALYTAFIHSINMLAMVGEVSVDTLKRKVGILNGSREGNPWLRFLSFAKAANTIAMPARNDPNASEILSRRNSANRRAYEALTDDENLVFSSRIFFALGGYPDYSAIRVADHQTSGDFEVLIPEVPKLTEEEEQRFRPLYDDLVDTTKVAKDREHNKAPSAGQMEQRSLQAFKKRAHQLNQEAILTNFDFYIIASSKTLGPGWCEEATTRPEISKWLKRRHNFQAIFPIYSQSKLDTIEDVDAAAAEEDAESDVQKRRRVNKCDLEKAQLTELISLNIVNALGHAPPNGIPRGPDPVAAFKKNKINVNFERSPDSAMTDDEFIRGFDGMKTLGRRHWIEDFTNGEVQDCEAGPTSNSCTV
ncbi:uncharacterized protein MELLADRAFT_88094 [Melampsora larici-populina 98AG31]|uniref:Uncharacterized protein n=1 Tax=Melampsora larici-populina (strain 98AG31 / pathotype 3-4-7) TaxID=747676 RepID=F4RQE9_MELLP|nr:uncharacterized protein MELLADRAFT_88094 [Melampsora larici-populina 98AG31]EGG05397.1 hypothetical protein MELLADRAFT_88094 [Melampsora larici-populina 98AG31]